MRFDDLCARIEAENPVSAEIKAEVDPPNILALNVVRMRDARGLTQAQLAEALGVAQPRIAEIERGDANPRLITLSRLALALGVTLPELLVDNLNAPFGRTEVSGDAMEERPRLRRRKIV